MPWILTLATLRRVESRRGASTRFLASSFDLRDPELRFARSSDTTLETSDRVLAEEGIMVGVISVRFRFGPDARSDLSCSAARSVKGWWGDGEGAEGEEWGC